MGNRSALKNDEKFNIMNLKNKNLSINAISRITKGNSKTIKKFLENYDKNRKIRCDKRNFRARETLFKRNQMNRHRIPLLSSRAVFNNSIKKKLPKSTRCKILKTLKYFF